MLLDDRDGVSPGVKFKDAELIGVPTIVVVGRGLADGVVEVKDRRTGERTDVAGRRRRRPRLADPSASETVDATVSDDSKNLRSCRIGPMPFVALA